MARDRTTQSGGSNRRRSALALALASMALAGMALIVTPAAAPAEAPAAAPFKDELAGKELIKALQAGGHVIFIRHAATEKDYADQVSAKMGDCSTQRMLSAQGWQQARDIGAAFVRHQIPTGLVYSSEYCRAWQTADLAFGRHIKKSELNFEPAEEYTDAQTAAMRTRVRPLLAQAPAPGFNTVIVGHDDPFEAATGLYPEPMGVTVVVRPDGKGGFELIADVPAEDWF